MQKCFIVLSVIGLLACVVVFSLVIYDIIEFQKTLSASSVLSATTGYIIATIVAWSITGVTASSSAKKQLIVAYVRELKDLTKQTMEIAETSVVPNGSNLKYSDEAFGTRVVAQCRHINLQRETLNNFIKKVGFKYDLSNEVYFKFKAAITDSFDDCSLNEYKNRLHKGTQDFICEIDNLLIQII